MKDEAPVRRPEVKTVAERLQREHPKWSWDRCLVEAKVIVTAPPYDPTIPRPIK